MQKMTFKTNINCNSCIRAVTGFIEAVPGLDKWEVDTANPDKVLTVEGDLNLEAVVEAVEGAGFDIEPLKTVS